MSLGGIKQKFKDDGTADEDARLQHLLDVATEVFLEQGYELASVGEMARRARASKQTFYSRFPTKDELFVAVMTRKCNLIFQEATATVLSGGTIAQVLSAISRAILKLALAPEGVALFRIVYKESGRFPALGRMFYEAGHARGLELVAAYLKEQMDQQKLRRADPMMAATHYIDMTVARLVTKAHLGINPSPSEKEKTKIIESAVDVFLRAYRSEI